MQDSKGLTTQEVLESRKKYGKNEVDYKKENGFWKAVKELLKEPMVVLLLVAALLYFISGDTGDAIFLASAIVLVAAISLYQDSRSRNALEKLKAYTEPECTVIRNGTTEKIKSTELVVGDHLVVEEGTSIAADARIIQANDFSVNESILTGESLSVSKDSTSPEPYLYQGTTVVSGLAIAIVTAIGNQTRLGQIGKSLESIKEEKTPLEQQIGNFVKKMVLLGAIIFLIVWSINYYHSGNLLDSLLKALTLAMSILPEEIPVAFTTFMALGAWRLMRLGILVKQMKTVETLGSATVICTDKTGTLTENKMSLAKIYSFQTDTISDYTDSTNSESNAIIRMAMWSSEPIPFDPMEIALHNAYRETHNPDERPEYKMAHEYPLGGKPPMMTHIFENSSKNRIIAAKGAPEAFLDCIPFDETQKNKINNAIQQLASDGYRILGVAEATFDGTQYPKRQQDFSFEFKGIVAFYDPPKKNIGEVLQQFYKAGITVKIVTGDNAETTTAIARQIQFSGSENSLNGDELVRMDEQELQQRVQNTHVFTRMYPEAKLKIINALKAQGEIVAMTGDGVNDGPALKAAHIGIAMGKKGTEIAKQAASLILLEDDLSKMVTAIAMGRRIYTNLKKAIQYIISIHIPIILTVFLPLALGWMYPNIFSPVHVIFLELIMGPTCSIIYENEPMEANSMNRKPRPFSSTFFNWKELFTSIIQGLGITAGIIVVYQFAVHNGYSENATRTLVFTTLIIANIFLTLVNRSFYYSVIRTLRYKNNMITGIILLTLVLLGMMLFIPPLTSFFEFEKLPLQSLALSSAVGFLSVIWFELVKGWKRSKEHNPYEQKK
ncbi:cation-translocating P-type ATPase [Flavobacterium sp.]|uniref:cation-translocating P-type ATPase n=1 Tax=Flavobacterium sp. TaxID=239 RepID=UPI002629335B|nr:cation-translocating P-type ATPase [Flavobacterium sp.]